MLILPIGQENNVVRRIPYVSFTLIGVNILFHLLLLLGVTGRIEREVEERFEDAVEYALDHPYLEVPERLWRYAGPQAEAYLRESRQEPEGDQVLRREEEQQELQAYADKLDAAVRRLPAWRMGFIPAEPRTVALLTSLFVHAGWLHLLGNMLFLFMSGPFIEDLYGRTLFALLYVASGIAATLTFKAQHPDSVIPLVGASGAIAGIMGAFLIRLGTSRIRLLVIPIPLLWMFRFKALVPAFVVLPLWFGEQIWYASTTGRGAGVAWWAHIGGFMAGVLAALAIRLSRAEEVWINPAIEKDITLTQNPGLERAVDARTAGDVQTARREISRVLAAEPGNVDAWTEAYEVGVAARDPELAGRAAQRLLELHLRQGDRDLAFQLFADARERFPGAPPARLLMSTAGLFEKEGDNRSALELYEEVAQRAPQDPAAFRALFRRGELLRAAGDKKGARAAYEQARAHPACTPPWPETIEKTLAQL
jgi:membrane associated rhomboid family serine protease